MRREPLLVGAIALTMGAGAACSSKRQSDRPDGGQGGQSGDDGQAGTGGEGGGGASDPTTCEAAAHLRSYIGCDYWPVPLGNYLIDLTFDFAVVVANAGEGPADVTVTGPGLSSPITASVSSGALTKIYLPWVDALREGFMSVKTAGAYHLVSSRPVTVYQFNPLEYRGVGGPPGKDWSGCMMTSYPYPYSCLSYSNDASLLIPSTAMTGNYRLTGYHEDGVFLPYFAVVGTHDGTAVTVKLSATGSALSGALPDTPGGGTLTFMLDAGEVMQVPGRQKGKADFSGSLLTASQPVEVFTGAPCAFIPDKGYGFCDHLEETVLPVETWGTRYVVAVSTGPFGDPVGHVVRIYGVADGTTLSYDPAPPPGAKTSLGAGEVLDLGVVKTDFLVTASNPISVLSFMLGASLLDDRMNQTGDPSQSVLASIEQFRKDYIFPSPNDYDVTFADVVAPDGTSLTLDGAAVADVPTAIGTSGYSVFRIMLSGMTDSHTLTASSPVGLQVMGYGLQTSYQFPGGLDLRPISTAPGP